MQNNAKEWLVRTRTGEVLGPFTQRELLEEFQRSAFGVDDEIAPSLGSWTSAQALGSRDIDEFTRTSTRSHHVTRSYQTKATADTVTKGDDEEDLTPTPDFLVPPPLSPQEPPPIRRTKSGPRSSLLSTLGPLITLLVLLGIGWLLVSQMKQRHPPIPTPQATGARNEGSPITRTVYDLIARGERHMALEQLNRFHERNQGKGEIDYLIPYAALLITEEESAPRARKFLEQVLTSGASPQLKARAHHWLGYLLLSEEEGDMGEGHFLESLQLNPKDAASRFNLGRAYLLQKKFPQALDYLKLAELEVPELWLVHLYIGRVKAELGYVQEARKSFDVALHGSPDRWLIYSYYAVFAYNFIHDEELAQKMLKTMLTRDAHYEVHSPVPFGFFQQKINYSEYLDIFGLIMAKNSGEEKELGRLYLNHLRHSGAGPEGRRIEATAASERASILSRILGLKVVLDRDTTADEIRTAVNRLPLQLSELGYYGYVLRAEARIRIGSYTEAQQDLQRALAMEPKSAVARLVNIQLYKKMQRQADAQQELQTLLSYHPGYIPAIIEARSF